MDSATSDSGHSDFVGKRSLFDTLPPEVRNSIYQFIWKDHSHITLGPPRNPKSVLVIVETDDEVLDPNGPKAKLAGLPQGLYANKQMLKESLAELTLRSTLKIDLHSSLSTIALNTAAFSSSVELSNISIKIKFPVIEKLVKTMPKLESVQLSVPDLWNNLYLDRLEGERSMVFGDKIYNALQSSAIKAVKDGLGCDVMVRQELMSTFTNKSRQFGNKGLEFLIERAPCVGRSNGKDEAIQARAIAIRRWNAMWVALSARICSSRTSFSPTKAARDHTVPNLTSKGTVTHIFRNMALTMRVHGTADKRYERLGGTFSKLRVIPASDYQHGGLVPSAWRKSWLGIRVGDTKHANSVVTLSSTIIVSTNRIQKKASSI
jgi:hypothetical protein